MSLLLVAYLPNSDLFLKDQFQVAIFIWLELTKLIVFQKQAQLEWGNNMHHLKDQLGQVKGGHSFA